MHTVLELKEGFKSEFNLLFRGVFGELDEELTDDEYNLRQAVCVNIIKKIQSNSEVTNRDFKIRQPDGPRQSFEYARCVAFCDALADLVEESSFDEAINIIKDSLESKLNNRRAKELASALLDESGLRAMSDVVMTESAHVVSPAPVEASSAPLLTTGVTLPFEVSRETSEQVALIWQKLQTENQPSPMGYYFDASNPQMANVLQEYVTCKLQALQFGRLSTQARQLFQPMQQLKAMIEASAQANESIIKDSDNDPVVFDKINQWVMESDRSRKVKLIAKHLNKSLEEVSQYSEQEIIAQYSQYERENNRLKAVNTQLSTLIERAKLPAQQQVQLIVDYCPESSKYTLSSNGSLTLGYAIHNLLISSQLFSREIEPRENAPLYDGSTVFSIDFSELSALNKFLSDLLKWHADFQLILGALLGRNDDSYIQVGQKPLREIILGEENRGRHLIEPRVTDQLRQQPQDSMVLLLGLVSLNLASYPQRDQVKACLEGMYRHAALKDNKGDDKVFIAGTYLSILSPDNIRAIMEELMSYANLSMIARGMGMSLFDETFRLIVSEGETLESLNMKVLRTYVTELPIDTPSRDRRAVVRSPARARQLSDYVAQVGFDFPAGSSESMVAAEQVFESVLGRMLNQFAGIEINLQTQSQESDITDVELRALLPRNTHSLFPQTSSELIHLFDCLKRATAYIELRQALLADGGVDLDLQISAFIEILKPRLDRTRVNTYGESYDGHGLTLQASEAVMTWVSRIYYQEKSQITNESIRASFAQLQAINVDRRDIERGCGTGLVGRCRMIASTLKTATDDPVYATVLDLRRQAASEVFNDALTRSGGESSMYATHISDLQVLLGVEPPVRRHSASQYTTTLTDSTRRSFFNGIARKITPATLYSAVAQTALTNFLALVQDDQDDDIYQMLKQYCFIDNRQEELSDDDKSTIDRAYRFDEGDASSAWDIAKFKRALPKAVIETLIVDGFINASDQYAHKLSICHHGRLEFYDAQAPSYGSASTYRTLGRPASSAHTVASVFGRRTGDQQVSVVAQSEFARSTRPATVT